MLNDSGLQSVARQPVKTAIVVVGMHRSGTSAMARLASLCGATLPAELMPANTDNVAGFWEPVRIADFNDALLSRLDRSWDDPRATDLADLGEADDTRRRLAESLAQDFGDATQIVLKEPRISRFVPLYDDALRSLGYRPVYVLMVRNPLAVAQSLQRRNGFDPAFSTALWQRYVTDAERATRNLPRVFVSFEAVVDDWRPEMAAISGRLDLGWNTRLDEASKEIESYLNLDAVHHSFGIDDLNAHGDQGLSATFDALVKLQADPGDLAAIETLVVLGQHLGQTSAASGDLMIAELRRRIITGERQAEQMRAEVAEAHGRFSTAAAETETLRAAVAEAHAQIAARDAEVAEAQGRIATTAAETETLRAEVAEVQAQIAARDADVARLQSDVEDGQQRLAALDVTLLRAELRAEEKAALAVRLEDRLRYVQADCADAHARASFLDQQLQSEMRELALVKAAMEALDHRYALIAQSTSWRVTMPLRVVGRLLKGEGLGPTLAPGWRRLRARLTRRPPDTLG